MAGRISFPFYIRNCKLDLQKRFSSTFAKKNKCEEKQEAFARVCDYNLKRRCYLRYLEGIPLKVGG